MESLGEYRYRRSGKYRPALPRSIRQRVLVRDKFRCRSCGILHIAADLEVHHVVPFSQGGSNSLDNLEAQCKDCHMHVCHNIKRPSKEVVEWGAMVTELL